MTVYVDPAVWKKPRGRKLYGHMVADSLQELHDFAASIGVKKHFFHKASKHPHYDITEIQRTTAITAGAKEVTDRELLKLSDLMNTLFDDAK